MRRTTGLIALSCLLCSGAVADDWPRFRGPNGSGIAEIEGLPQQISADSALWKIA